MSQTVRFRMLDGATVTGDGPLFELDYPILAAALQVEIGGGPASRVAGTLQGRLDGSTFDTLCEIDTDEGYLSGEIVNFPLPMLVRQIKFNLSQLVASSGGTPTVSVYFAGRS